MEYLSIICLLFCILASIRGDCVDDKKAELRTCFDALKNDLTSENPSDLNNFMCSTTQKERLNCIIKYFKECPDFESESFIDELKHTGGNFHVKDLFYIKSADEFCKCVPTLTCFENIETEQMYMQVDRKTWQKMADPSYICGIGRNYIDCVAKSLPICTNYLQYKHNESMSGVSDVEHFDVGSLAYAGVFAENRCTTWPEDANSHNCTKKRSDWYSVEVCHHDAGTLADEQDRMCGMRKCVEKAMITCPKGDMDYFIDAVNVFAEDKITAEPCVLSSATVTLATIFSIMISLGLAMLC